MRKFLFLLLVLTISLRVCAQFAPAKGKVIMFYPISDAIRNSANGYDCFYSTDDAYRNGKINCKPKLRFKKNEFNLTPYEEIEKHTFTVLDYYIENKDSKKIEKKTCICFLKRDDGEKMFLRIPYICQQEDNIITRSFLIPRTTSIDIPCCYYDQYKYIKKDYQQQNVVNYPEVTRSFNYENSKRNDLDKKLFTNHLSFLGNKLPKYFSKRYGTVFYCEQVSFENVEGYAFKQPICRFRYNEGQLIVPMFDFRGSGEASYGSNYTVLQFFSNKEQLLNEKMANLNKRELSIVGDTLYYAQELKSKYSYETLRDALCIQYRNSENTYKVKSNIPYKCTRIDLANEFAKDYSCPSLYAILTDPSGTEIQVPLIKLAFKEKYDYDEMFKIASEEKARQEAWVLKNAKEQEELDEKIAKYTPKYGKEGAKVIAKGYCSEEDYAHWKKQYGERTAVMIAKGLYDVGFPKSAFYVAINKDYIKLIASYSDQTGSYEVIQHREFNPKYVTFRNGKIISITDFY